MQNNESERKYSEHQVELSRKLKQLQVELKRMAETLSNRNFEFDEARESWKLERDKLESEKQILAKQREMEIDKVKDGEEKIVDLKRKIGDIETRWYNLSIFPSE